MAGVAGGVANVLHPPGLVDALVGDEAAATRRDRRGIIGGGLGRGGACGRARRHGRCGAHCRGSGGGVRGGTCGVGRGLWIRDGYIDE
jgi:hypothetical protein